MSNASTLDDWSKPAATAIPKEGYFTLEQGRYGPTYPRTPACHGFTIIAKIKPGTEVRSAPTARRSKTRSPRAHTRSRRCSFITCDGCCSTSVRTSTSSTRAFSTLISTSTPKTPFSSSKPRGSIPSSRSWKGFRRTGRRTLRRSSSSCASTSVRVSSSTARSLCISRRNQEGARTEAGVFVHARPDAVTHTGRSGFLDAGIRRHPTFPVDSAACPGGALRVPPLPGARSGTSLVVRHHRPCRSRQRGRIWRTG